MDITNNVSTPNNNPITQLAGAKNYDDSSDYDVSSDITSLKKKKGQIITEENMIDILQGKDLSFEVENFNPTDLNKIPYFNTLTSNQKTLIINRLYDKIPKNQKNKPDTNISTKDSYFYCKNCGYNEKIPPRTFIFSRKSEKSSEDTFSSRFANFKHDKTLPTTKKYNCINKECSTHSKPELKNAVFHRIGNTYAIRYICSVCNHYWSTSVENQ
jgi:hypothetical protein